MKQEKTWLMKLIYGTYGRFLTRKYGITLVNSAGADYSDGSFLILSNHVGTLDPFIIGFAMKTRLIRWVTGAYLFKMPFLRTILSKHALAIPKQQGRSDISTVRNMQMALKDGYVVGIFPEGTRTWDGEMMPINYKSLAKMVRMFKAPVLVVNLEGGFAQKPRWCDTPRKGAITVNLRKMITSDEIASMSLEELQNCIKDNLEFSNDSWKNVRNYGYVCEKRAEGLQKLLYMCPSCRAIGSMTTKGDKIMCPKCNTVAMLDNMDNITSINIPFRKMSLWHAWEREQLASVDSLEPEEGVLFQTGDSDNEGELRTLSENITVGITDKVMTVKCLNDNSVYELPLDKITSFVLNAKQTMELFCDNVLYRVRLKPESSSLKFQEFYLEHKKTEGES